jgi:hypothetical protein
MDDASTSSGEKRVQTFHQQLQSSSFPKMELPVHSIAELTCDSITRVGTMKNKGLERRSVSTGGGLIVSTGQNNDQERKWFELF